MCRGNTSPRGGGIHIQFSDLLNNSPSGNTTAIDIDFSMEQETFGPHQPDMTEFIGEGGAQDKADQPHALEVDDTQVAYFMNTSFVGNSATLGGALYISRSCAYLLLLVLYCCTCCDWMID